MSVSENVIKQVCAIDHFIGKFSFLLINQFIKRDFNLSHLQHSQNTTGRLSHNPARKLLGG